MSLTTMTTIIWICFLSRESSLEVEKQGSPHAHLMNSIPSQRIEKFTSQTRIRNMSPDPYDITIRMAKKVRKMKLLVELRNRFDYAISWIIICEKWVFWVPFHSVFRENTIWLITYWEKQTYFSQRFINFALKFNIIKNYVKAKST